MEEEEEMEILTGGERGSQVSGKSRTWQRVMMMGLARQLGSRQRERGREAESRVRNS